MPLFGPPNVEKLKAKRDIKGLIKALSYQKDDAVGQAATEALVEIGALAVDPLIAALKDSKAHNAAIEALTSIGLPAVEPLIVSVKQWDSEGLESTVLSFNEVMEVNLATAADTKALELRPVGFGWIILEKCSDDDPATESIGICIPPMDEKSTALTAAADVLGRIGASAVELLLGALKDDDWRVRVGAARALGRIGDSRAVEPLLDALRNDDWYVRKGAARALGRIEDSRATDPLIGALKDPHGHARQSAAMALGQIGDGCAIEPIKAALEDEDKSLDQIIGYLVALEKLGVRMPIRLSGWG